MKYFNEGFRLKRSEIRLILICKFSRGDFILIEKLFQDSTDFNGMKVKKDENEKKCFQCLNFPFPC